jgi:hypothetical protein
MNNNMKQYKSILIVLMLGVIFSSCFKDEYLNPSQASNESVITNTNGLLALCNGLQQKYSIGRASPLYTTITASGLSTNELLVLNQGNTDEANLQAGKGNVIGNNQIVTRLWEQSLLLVANADLILANIDIVGDANTKNSILAFAHLYKGLALMNLGTFWEQAPIATGKQAGFVPRKQVIETAVKLFEDGANLGAITLSPALQGGIDFNNTFNALAARGNMMLGNYAKALDFANKVDLKKKSEFTFDAISRNPIFDVHYSNVNVCEPTNNRLGMPATFAPDTTDARLLFYLKSRTFGPTNDGKGFFTANDSKIPVYLPGEVMLLKAEALARLDKIDDAVAELNKVRTKVDDIYNVNAKLPVYSGPTSKDEVLAEIYLNRCVELYNSGLKLEDSRRFNRPGPKETNFERNRNFYPYPTSERDNNPNTPPDPEI